MEIYDGQYLKTLIAQLYEVDSLPYSILVNGDTGKILAMGALLRGNELILTVERALVRKKK